jgi:hypothetical protein
LALVAAIAIGSTACAGSRTAAPSPVTANAAFTTVSADGISALIPEGWVAQPAEDSAPYQGLTASPGPGVEERTLLRQGLIATRIDATDIGVPSDLYYLAAKGPLIEQVTRADGCRVTGHRVYVNHRPAWLQGSRSSPGDFIATGRGRCAHRGTATRWSYFVAAPGFGPARERGIPGSGLYLIVAATPAAPGAVQTLATMIKSVRFGQDTARDFVRAVRAA